MVREVRVLLICKFHFFMIFYKCAILLRVVVITIDNHSVSGKTIRRFIDTRPVYGKTTN